MCLWREGDSTVCEVVLPKKIESELDQALDLLKLQEIEGTEGNIKVDHRDVVSKMHTRMLEAAQEKTRAGRGGDCQRT